MIDFPYLDEIVIPTTSKIIMLTVDGLGGLPDPETRKSELETARLPNLDRLAAQSACGLTTPVVPGVAPGSGPGHLGLFGYDPLKYLIGRGVLEALGIGVQLEEGDVAARGNFCTVDPDGLIIDRRAGRISTSATTPLVHGLDQITLPQAELSVYPVQDYRFALVLRGEGVGERVSETDPERHGVPPLDVRALPNGDGVISVENQRTAASANVFIAEAKELLREQQPANMILLRGFSHIPHLPSMSERYRLAPAAIAAYPMYRGLASLVGMQVLSTGTTFKDEITTLKERFDDHDFFYIHYKPADTAGEDGDFDAKVQALEALDAFIPALMELQPDVFMVTGDHATPSSIASHSWHPVPFLLHSRWTHGEGVDAFHERACGTGSLGRIPATSVMMLALAHAGKLTKFGP